MKTVASELPQPRGGEIGLFIYQLPVIRASLIAQLVKNPPTMQAIPVWFLVRKIHWRRDRLPTSVFLGFVGKSPWRRKRLPTLVFWPREFHGLYNPWGHKDSDTTEQLSLHFLSSFGKSHYLGTFFFFFFNLNIFDFQCCVSFRYTADFQIIFPYRLLQNTDYNSLCYIVHYYYLSFTYKWSRSVVSNSLWPHGL